MRTFLQQLYFTLQHKRGKTAVFMSLLGLVMIVLGSTLVGESSISINASPQVPVQIYVDQGERLSQSIERWEKLNKLQNPLVIRTLARLRGDASEIKSGLYLFTEQISARQLLDYLVQGNTQLVSMVIPEGYSIKDIYAVLKAKSISNADKFFALTKDQKFIASLNLPFANTPASLEGLLFPDTYFLGNAILPEALIKIMVEEFVNKAYPLLKKSSVVGLTPYQTLILASIVEKETGANGEQSKVASVFHNRLRRRMRLDSDPTVIYGVPNFDGNLTRRHLRKRTPYNTYRMKGLTPTPIANPGIESIKGTLYPLKTRYLFFVAMGDSGRHYFSKTLREHEAAVDKYQRFRRKR